MSKDHSGIHSVTLRGYDDNFAPLTQDMVVEMVVDTVFFTIREPGEGASRTAPDQAGSENEMTFAVRLDVLEAAIAALKRHPG